MKRKIILIAFLLLILAGCKQSLPNEYQEITDSMGNTVSIPKEVNKIISTAPSNTEILLDLGLSDKLVGVDEWSMKIDGVNESTQSVGVTKGDVEKMLELEPDLVLASAINFSSGEDPYILLKESGISVVYLTTPETAQGIIEDINLVGQVTGATDQAKILTDELIKILEDIKAVGLDITDKKKVYFEIGSTPTLYTQGNKTFINDFIEIIGANNIFADQEYWFSPSIETILEANPDVIFTSEDYLPTAIENIKSRDGFAEIDAVKNDRVYLISSDESSRATARAFNALKEMAKLIYPEHYDY